MATGSRWSSTTSSMRSFMSAGPSTSTCAGRSARIVSRTRRAQAGLWWRTPMNVAVTGSPGEGVARAVEGLPVPALLPRHLLLEVAAEPGEVLRVVLGRRAPQALHDVGLVAGLVPEEPTPQADRVRDRHGLR